MTLTMTAPVENAETTVIPFANIANLLNNLPEPYESIEFDAYFSGANPFILIGDPATYYQDRLNCPSFINNTLTDEPFLAGLGVLHRGMSNRLPPEAPWLSAVLKEEPQPQLETALGLSILKPPPMMLSS